MRIIRMSNLKRLTNMHESNKKEELMEGAPELAIIRLVRRAHDHRVCPHKGECLNEPEMIQKLSEFLKSLVRSELTSLARDLVGVIPKDKIQRHELDCHSYTLDKKTYHCSCGNDVYTKGHNRIAFDTRTAQEKLIKERGVNLS